MICAECDASATHMLHIHHHSSGVFVIPDEISDSGWDAQEFMDRFLAAMSKPIAARDVRPLLIRGPAHQIDVIARQVVANLQHVTELYLCATHAEDWATSDLLFMWTAL